MNPEGKRLFCSNSWSQPSFFEAFWALKTAKDKLTRQHLKLR